jgi:hypothetical protein
VKRKTVAIFVLGAGSPRGVETEFQGAAARLSLTERVSSPTRTCPQASAMPAARRRLGNASTLGAIDDTGAATQLQS